MKASNEPNCGKIEQANSRGSTDQQVWPTDPDARSMATSGRGTGIVGYNVHTGGTPKTILIVRTR